MVPLINVSNVAPEDQQRLVDVLVDATQTVMRDQQGFISANIHRILDGTRVTNYAQWQSREAFEAMLGDREAAEHMGEAARIAEWTCVGFVIPGQARPGVERLPGKERSGHPPPLAAGFVRVQLLLVGPCRALRVGRAAGDRPRRGYGSSSHGLHHNGGSKGWLEPQNNGVAILEGVHRQGPAQRVESIARAGNFGRGALPLCPLATNHR